MAISVVQATFGGTTAAASTVAKAFTSNVTTGNTIVVVFSANITSALSVSSIAISPGSGTFSSIIVQADTANGIQLEGWGAANVTGGTTPTVTVTMSRSLASGETAALAIYEVSGLATALSTDGTAVGNNGTSTAGGLCTTSAITTTNANDILFSGFVPGSHMTAGQSGWTFQSDGGTYTGFGSQYNIVSATQSGLTATATCATGPQHFDGIVFALQAAAAGGGISVVQSASNSVGNTSSPLSAAFSSNNSAGNLLVASFWANNFSGITDSAGNSWTLLFSSSYTVSTEKQYVYYCLSSRAGANTVTISFTGAGSYCGMVILEASGGTWTVDGTPTGSSAGSGTALSSGAMTTTGTNDLIISGTYNSSNLATTVGSGWTLVKADPFNNICQSRIVTTAGSYTATASVGSTTGWMCDIAAFTATTGGSTLPVTIAGNIAVTGTPIVTLVFNWTVPGFPLLTGTVTPTLVNAGTLPITITGSVAVTGVIQPSLSIPVSGTAVVTAAITPGLAIPINGSVAVTGTVTPALLQTQLFVTVTGGIVRVIGGVNLPQFPPVSSVSSSSSMLYFPFYGA